MNFAKLLSHPASGSIPEPPPHIIIPAIRTNCLTGIAETVFLHCEIAYIDSLKSWWVKIENGVTGYESAEVSAILEDARNRWSACAGTHGLWDSLVIESEGMTLLKQWLRERPELRCENSVT